MYFQFTLFLWRIWRFLLFPRPSRYFDALVTCMLWSFHLYLVAGVGYAFAQAPTFSSRLGVLIAYLILRFLVRSFSARIERAAGLLPEGIDLSVSLKEEGNA